MRLAAPPRGTTSGCRRNGWRRSSSEPLEVGEPDLDERPHALLEPCLARDRQRLLVALPDLLRRDALLQAVVAGEEQVVDFFPGRDLFDAGYVTRSKWPLTPSVS
jgi:hypothetical protein